MSAHAYRLARLFTPEYARRINTLVVYPAQSQVVKPNELESALARPVNTAIYEPERPGSFLAATLSYGLIKGHPFMDGNKRTAFLLAHEFLRAQGLPGLVPVDGGKVSVIYKELTDIADRHIAVASGKLDIGGLLSRSDA